MGEAGKKTKNRENFSGVVLVTMASNLDGAVSKKFEFGGWVGRDHIIMVREALARASIIFFSFESWK